MNTLAKAMRAFVQSGGDRSRMDVPAWALTYGVGVESIREAWEREMTTHSTRPQNAYEEGGK
jgi:hypothetical protein